MNRTKITSLIIFCVLTTTTSAFAEVLRWPQGCLRGQLQVTNPTGTEMQGWVQKFKPSLVSETEHVFQANSTTKISIAAKSTAESFSLLHLGSQGSLQATFHCKTKSYPAHSFEGGILTYRRTDFSENILQVINLYSAENMVNIQLLDRRFNILSESTLKLKSRSKTNFKISTVNWSYARVSGDHRLAVFNMTTTGSEGPMIIARQPSQVTEGAAYFEMQSRDKVGDSFIVKITSPEMIQQARAQIANPSLEKILFAKVTKGHAGFNRNWSKKDRAFWSWSTTEVTAIADLASTSCNGIPQAVEDRVDFWIKNPGRICFWSYRIQRELKPVDVASGETLQ